MEKKNTKKAVRAAARKTSTENEAEKVVETEVTVSIPTTTIVWNGNTLTVSRRLTFAEMLGFVKNVVELCFSEADEYLPEVQDFALRSSVIQYYGRIALPPDIEQKYTLVYDTDLCKVIMDNIDKEQFNAMLDAISMKIRYRAQANIEELRRNMNDMIRRFEELEYNIASIFTGIDGDTMRSVADAVSSGAFDMEKLVTEVLKQRDTTKE